MNVTIIELGYRDDTLYHPFTTDMWRQCNGKIAAIKLWRAIHKAIPVGWDDEGQPVYPSRKASKRIVELAERAVKANPGPTWRDPEGWTCRVIEDRPKFKGYRTARMAEARRAEVASGKDLTV